MKEDPSIQNFAKQSIRRLLDSVEDGDVAKDESLSFDYDTNTGFGKFRFNVNRFVLNQKKKKN